MCQAARNLRVPDYPNCAANTSSVDLGSTCDRNKSNRALTLQPVDKSVPGRFFLRLFIFKFQRLNSLEIVLN